MYMYTHINATCWVSLLFVCACVCVESLKEAVGAINQGYFWLWVNGTERSALQDFLKQGLMQECKLFSFSHYWLYSHSVVIFSLIGILLQLWKRKYLSFFATLVNTSSYISSISLEPGRIRVYSQQEAKLWLLSSTPTSPSHHLQIFKLLQKECVYQNRWKLCRGVSLKKNNSTVIKTGCVVMVVVVVGKLWDSRNNKF